MSKKKPTGQFAYLYEGNADKEIQNRLKRLKHFHHGPTGAELSIATPKRLQIKIFQLDNGFIMGVDGKVLTFPHREGLFKALRDFFDDPVSAGKKHVRAKV